MHLFSVTKPQQVAHMCRPKTPEISRNPRGVSHIFKRNSRASWGRFACFYPRKDDEVSGHVFDIEKESKMRWR